MQYYAMATTKTERVKEEKKQKIEQERQTDSYPKPAKHSSSPLLNPAMLEGADLWQLWIVQGCGDTTNVHILTYSPERSSLLFHSNSFWIQKSQKELFCSHFQGCAEISRKKTKQGNAGFYFAFIGYNSVIPCIKLEAFAPRPSLQTENTPGPFHLKANSSEQMLLNVQLSAPRFDCLLLIWDDTFLTSPYKNKHSNNILLS